MPDNPYEPPKEASQNRPDAHAAVPLEWEITDTQRQQYSANCSWPIPCAWCRDGSQTIVPLADVDGVAFHCDVCGKASLVQQQGNKITSTPTVILGSLRVWTIVVVLLLVVAVVGVSWLILSVSQ